VLSAADLLAFNAALLLAVAAPGPAFLLVARTGIAAGARAGIAAGLGLGLVAAFWTLAALSGLDTLFEAYPATYQALRRGGAALLILAAGYIWWEATRPPGDRDPISRRRAFAAGAMLNLVNPKTVIFSVAVLIVIFPPGLSAVEMGMIGLNHAAIETLFYAGLAVFIGRDGVRLWYGRAKPVVNRVSAVVLGGLGLRLLMTE
jgi:threonine/homoserine/homoserine lactone efflux protein